MGSGHVMRCLTLADILKKNGFTVTFISRKHIGNLNQFIVKKGFEVIELDKPDKSIINRKESQDNSDDYSGWLGVNEIQDAEDTIRAIGDEKPVWLIIDHYSLGKEWENKLRRHVKNIMVIDDLANRLHNCDILLDQNWFNNLENRYDGLLPINCTKLLGPKYALLRPEFALARKALKPRNGKVERIFVFFGGSDPHNLTGITLQALLEPELIQFEIDVAIGENNIFRDLIQKIAKSRERTHLHIQVDNMAHIMAKADLAVASGGINTLERICLDLFSLVITTANNQIPTIKDLNAQKSLKFLGNYKDINQNKIGAYIKNFVSNKVGNNTNKMIIDGLGSIRAIKVLLNSLI